MRLIVSVPLPAPNGTISVIGLFGYVCACAATPANATHPATSNRSNVFIALFLPFIPFPDDQLAACVVPAQAGIHTPCPRGQGLWVPAPRLRGDRLRGNDPSEPALFIRIPYHSKLHALR